MKKLFLGITAALTLTSQLSIASTHMPYEGANCQGLLSVGDSINISRSVIIKNKIEQFKSFSERLKGLVTKRGELLESEEQEIAKIEKKIDEKIEQIKKLSDDIEKEKLAISEKLSPDELELLSLDNGFIPSEDCETMYVLPPSSGNATFMSAGFLGGISQCSSYNFYDKMKDMAQKQMTAIEERMASATPDQYIELLKISTLLEKKLDNYDRDKIKLGRNWVGFSASILFDSKWNYLVREYKLRNPDKKVVQMIVTNSKLRFDSGKSSKFGENNDGIYHFNVPGIGNRDETVFFNGSKSGLLQLNLIGSCPIFESLGKKFDFNDKTLVELNQAIGSQAGGQIAVDVEFEYPVYTKKGYEIKINSDTLKTVFNKIVKKKKRFNTETLHKLLFDTEGEQAIEVIVYNESPNDNREELNEYVRELKDKLEDKIAMEFLEMFAQPTEEPLRIMLNGKVEEKVKIDDQKWKDIVHSTKQCRTSKSWFRQKTRCWTHSWTTKQYITSIDSNTEDARVSFSRKLRESAVFKGTVTRKKSMAFANKR